jgi:hypothetical protein
MPKPIPHEVTQLLLAWSEGDKAAMDKLMPLVYGELRRLAKQHMRRERAADGGGQLDSGGEAVILR